MSFFTQLDITIAFFAVLATILAILLRIDDIKKTREAKEIRHNTTHRQYHEMDLCPLCDHEFKHKTLLLPKNCDTCIKETLTQQREKLLGPF